MDKETDEQTNSSEFIGLIYIGGTTKQQKIKTRIRKKKMHVYYCQSQFNQKMFHRSLKTILFPLYRQPSINSPTALYEIISSFRPNLYLIFKEWQGRSC